jgi:hypothetical protein
VDHDALLKQYLDRGHNVAIDRVLRTLPPDVDLTLAVRSIERWFCHAPRACATACMFLPPRVVRAVLSANLDGAWWLFFRIAAPLDLPDDRLRYAWSCALAVPFELATHYSWGSHQRCIKVARIANDDSLLPALQAAVAHSHDAPRDMLAVLVADGSDASYDALVRHIDQAVATGDERMDLLAALRTHARRTPALAALFAELDTALAQRNATSPARALGPVIGIGTVATLWFTARVESTQLTPIKHPRAYVEIAIDSRQATWLDARFRVTSSQQSLGTYFTHDTVRCDELAIGRCAAAELPQWIAKVSVKYRVDWAPVTIRSNVRGTKRDRIATWLLGA